MDEEASQAALVERWKAAKASKMESRWASAVTYVQSLARRGQPRTSLSIGRPNQDATSRWAGMPARPRE